MKGLELNNCRIVGMQGHPIEGFLVITSVNLVLVVVKSKKHPESHQLGCLNWSPIPWELRQLEENNTAERKESDEKQFNFLPASHQETNH